jgi:hypothetical protein
VRNAARRTLETPLGMPARVALGALAVAGAVVAAPSGIGLVWFIPYAGVGTLLAVRRPGTSIGWLLVALSWALAIVQATVDATPAQFADGSLGPLTAAFAVAQAVSGFVMFYLLTILAVVFPSGRLPAGRWGVLARLGLAAGLVLLAAAILMPVISVSLAGASISESVRNPVGVLPDLPAWSVITPDTVILPLVAMLAGSVVSLFVRFRRATGIERQQLRWITAALGLLIAGVLAGFAVGAIVPAASESGVAWIGPIVAIPLVAIAIGIAVLRYRLYEIDRIVSRTISWALTTGLIVALFAGIVMMLQALLVPVTSESTLAVAASTLAVAAVFQPARRRIQAVVDRRFNRRRYDAERIVDDYAARLRGVSDLDEVGSGALEAVTRSLGPSGASIWIRSSRGGDV